MIPKILGSEILIRNINDNENMEDWMFPNGVMLFLIISRCL
jgi:hypothetical protein